MTDNSNKHYGFYRTFEDRFRGSRELIRARLEVYKAFLDVIHSHDGPNLALDVGCGRGEWLELLQDSGFEATGVDLDEPMLATCRERGLSVHKADAIEYISSLPDASQILVSGFHIAEHLPFEMLQTLVEQAHRVLKPGGILILETPNPENLRVSSLTFYLDPTHNHPIPPLLLSFMTEYYGFDRNKVVRLQEDIDVAQRNDVTLEQALGSASRDYSVVAQKHADNSTMRRADEAFTKDYGIIDSVLFNRFENKLSISLAIQSEKLQEEIMFRESEFNKIHSDYRSIFEVVEKNRNVIERDIDLLKSNNDVYFRSLEEKMDSQHRQLAAIYTSRSWRITAPFRSAARFCRWSLRGICAWLTLKPGSRPRRSIHALITHAMLWVRRRPLIFTFALKVLRLFPSLERRLFSSAHARGLALSYGHKVVYWQIDVDPKNYRKWQNLLK